MNLPVVSVILPTRNRVAMLPVSAGSVLAQSYTELELLIVDDGSEEDVASAAAALGDSRVKYIRREVCGGPAAARNTGLQHAVGRYVAFQDSDDEWLLDKLALQMELLADCDDRTMAICGLVRKLGSRTRLCLPVTPGSAGPNNVANVASHPITYTQTWLVPRKALIELNGFDERLRVWEDWELLLRLSQRLDIQTLSSPLVVSYQSEDSVTYNNRPAFISAMKLILDKHAAIISVYPRAYSKLLYILGRQQITEGDLRSARASLCSSVVKYPFNLRGWLLLISSVLGRRWVTRKLRKTTIASESM